MIIQVVYRRPRWVVRKCGAKRALKSFTTKVPAIKWGKQYAKEKGSTLYIHKKDGSVRARFKHTKVIK